MAWARSITWFDKEFSGWPNHLSWSANEAILAVDLVFARLAGEDPRVNEKRLRTIASAGLAIGGIFGLAGTFAPSASLRGLAWGVDGVGLVTASAILTIWFYRKGQDLVAAGFLVFLVGQGLILSGAAMDLVTSAPSFGAGISLWAAALLLVSLPGVFPPAVRSLGLLAALLFAVTALRIFARIEITPLSAPLPFYAYPVLVATIGGWIWSLLKGAGPAVAPGHG